jgi:hypothetical protein
MFALLQYAQLQGEPESRCLGADQLIQKGLGCGRAVQLVTHSVMAKHARNPTERFTFEHGGHDPVARVFVGRRRCGLNQRTQHIALGTADQRNLDALRRM